MHSPIVHEPHQMPDRVYVHMKDVKSRSIRRVGYNPDTRQLVIQFYDSLPGLRTVYAPVPQDVYEALLRADSMGQYLDENIRYTYDFALVDEEGLIDPEKTRRSKATGGQDSDKGEH